MTADEVKRILGPTVGPELLSDILRTGASPVELARARAWIEADEAQVDAHAPFPSGVVGELVEILDGDRPDDEMA